MPALSSPLQTFSLSLPSPPPLLPPPFLARLPQLPAGSEEGGKAEKQEQGEDTGRHDLGAYRVARGFILLWLRSLKCPAKSI